MKIKLLKLIALWAVACLPFSCNDSSDIDIDMSKIDFSNIEDLYAQPLPVIQKCVEGMWQWIEVGAQGWEGVPMAVHSLAHTFVTITKDIVFIDSGDSVDLCRKFSYSWKNISDYTSYVMWNNEQKSGEWYFDKIQNDSLFVHSYNANSGGFSNSYLFIRIK